MRNIVWNVAWGYVGVWWSAVTLGRTIYTTRPESRLAQSLVFVHQTLWIGTPVALLLQLALAPAPHSMLDPFWRALGTLYLGWVWWVCRNWPDDTWTRRGRRLKEKIAALGGKLVVVPETT